MKPPGISVRTRPATLWVCGVAPGAIGSHGSSRLNQLILNGQGNLNDRAYIASMHDGSGKIHGCGLNKSSRPPQARWITPCLSISGSAARWRPSRRAPHSADFPNKPHVILPMRPISLGPVRASGGSNMLRPTPKLCSGTSLIPSHAQGECSPSTVPRRCADGCPSPNLAGAPAAHAASRYRRSSSMPN